MYESRLSYFNDKARINYCKSPSVNQHGGPSRPRQNCHSCIFETKENSNLRICIQYLGHHSKTTCRKSAKSMGYRVMPKFEFYRKSLLMFRFVWWLIRTKHVPESKNTFQNPKHFPESKNTTQNPKTIPRIQNTSQDPKTIPGIQNTSQNSKTLSRIQILGRVLDSGTCFGFLEIFLHSGMCF